MFASNACPWKRSSKHEKRWEREREREKREKERRERREREIVIWKLQLKKQTSLRLLRDGKTSYNLQCSIKCIHAWVVEISRFLLDCKQFKFKIGFIDLFIDLFIYLFIQFSIPKQRFDVGFVSFMFFLIFFSYYIFCR